MAILKVFYKMNKNFRKLIAFGVILISLSVFFYLLIYLPNKDKAYQKQTNDQKVKELAIKEKEQDFILQQKCSVDGKKYFDDLKSSSVGKTYSEPLYAYSDQLNTCLIYLHVIDKYLWDIKDDCAGGVSEEIKDIYSNHSIAYYFQFARKDDQGNCDHMGLTKDKFMELYYEYFGD